MRIFHPLLVFSVVLLSALSAARADNPVQWTIVEEIRRTDTSKTWTSPTAVDLDKMVWVYDFEITKVTGTVNLSLLGDVTQDITNSIPPEMREGSGESSDLPAVLLSEAVVHEESGSSANLMIEVDSQGFGRALFSNIVLGSINVPLFGERPIQRLNLEANVTVIGYDFGDFNRDGAVDSADYVVWRKDGGSTDDYELWRSHFGTTSDTSLLLQAAVPEPGCIVTVFIGGAIAVAKRRRLPPGERAQTGR